jgi:hypothetical protein
MIKFYGRRKWAIAMAIVAGCYITSKCDNPAIEEDLITKKTDATLTEIKFRVEQRRQQVLIMNILVHSWMKSWDKTSALYSTSLTVNQ